MGSGSFQIGRLTSRCLGACDFVLLSLGFLPDQSRLIHFPGSLAQGKCWSWWVGVGDGAGQFCPPAYCPTIPIP